jgi:hypothetical protein
MQIIKKAIEKSVYIIFFRCMLAKDTGEWILKRRAELRQLS